MLKLKASRLKDRHRALGLIVEYLSRSPVFRAQYFGDWTGVLMGQINRDHYLIGWRGERMVGFVGWARSDLQDAELWLDGKHNASSDNYIEGPCMIINAWMTDDESVMRFFRNCLQKDVIGVEWIFGKRVYQDGTVRKIRQPIRR